MYGCYYAMDKYIQQLQLEEKEEVVSQVAPSYSFEIDIYVNAFFLLISYH